MKLLRPSALFTVIFVLGAAPAAFAQSFAVAATPVNTASAGTGSIKYTVTGIPADGHRYSGLLYSRPSTYQEQNKLPVCNGGSVVAFPVTTGQTLTGTIGLIPWGAPMPLALHRAPHNLPRVFVSGFLFAGALFLGFALRRSRVGWLSLILIAVSTLPIATGLSACGGNSNGPTPGVYPYTITAEFSYPQNPLSTQTTATVMVTVP